MGTDKKDIFVAAELRWKKYAMKRPNVLVYGVHLSSGENQKREDARLDEIQTVLNLLKTNLTSNMILLMGDFNTDPFSTENVAAKCVSHVSDFSVNGTPFFCSAYDLPESPSDGAFTTMKERGGNDDTRRNGACQRRQSMQSRRRRTRTARFPQWTRPVLPNASLTTYFSSAVPSPSPTRWRFHRWRPSNRKE